VPVELRDRVSNKPSSVLDVVRALSKSAEAGLIFEGRLERAAPPTSIPSEPDAALEQLSRLLEVEGLQMVDGPHGMRVAVPLARVPAWPGAFPESTWVRERCRTRGPMGVHFNIIHAPSRDIAAAAAHLTATELSGRELIPAHGQLLSILTDRSYSLVEACQIYEAALLLAGFEIAGDGDRFAIRRAP
jgi:hypothetical protein